MKGKPRIAMISTHGYVAAKPPLGAADTGGQVVYVLELSRKLAQLGYDVDIWTRRFEQQPAGEPVTPGVRIIRMECGGEKFIPKEYLHRSIPEWCENALRYIDEKALRYVFINSHYWDAGLAGQHLSDVLDVPHLHTPHSLGLWKQRQMETDFPEDEARLEKEFNFQERIRAERLLYSECDMVIATTPIQMDMLTEEYEVPEAKSWMIPPGYDDARFYPVSEATERSIRQRLHFKGRVVLALGRLATNKGYDLLIQSFQLVASRVPEATLVLAIGGTHLDAREEKLLAELKALARDLGLQDRVRFTGFVPDAELADYYRAADIFVLSSRYEPFGMTAIEAMACGTPTVITTHGGLFRVVTFGRHALFADPFDKEDLGITTCKPLRHPKLYYRLGRMGAHKARSLFTWTGIAQQLVALVEHRKAAEFSLHDQEWDEPWNDGD
ncbi:MAG: glycosyltransferase [Verrucomicrobiota bacterium]